MERMTIRRKVIPLHARMDGQTRRRPEEFPQRQEKKQQEGPVMEHLTVHANGAAFHVARTGTGKPLLLLHGWPEFWLTWEPVKARLADRFTPYAPDMRGFGDSDKPDGPFGPDRHAADMLALMDALGLTRAGIVGHDVGGAAMQPMARSAPERTAGLFFFDFVYPGIGARMAEPDRLNHIWYQSFNQLDMAVALVGEPRELPYLHRALPENLVAPQGRLRRRAGNLHRQFLKARQSRRRICALSRVACRPDQDAEGRSAEAAADRCADLRPLGGIRSAISLCLDRSLKRNLCKPRSRDVCRRRTFSASRRSRSRRRRDCGFFERIGWR
ncbi:alpha/beta fold hydrolase [Bradyrhizobium sp.]|uniref:alpha/beta fold hydrolase n=1 Tax=Bradyrhizobium sp. TaxID=376 RepID=UPI003BB009BD